MFLLHKPGKAKRETTKKKIQRIHITGFFVDFCCGLFPRRPTAVMLRERRIFWCGILKSIRFTALMVSSLPFLSRLPLSAGGSLGLEHVTFGDSFIAFKFSGRSVLCWHIHLFVLRCLGTCAGIRCTVGIQTRYIYLDPLSLVLSLTCWTPLIWVPQVRKVKQQGLKWYAIFWLVVAVVDRGVPIVLLQDFITSQTIWTTTH